MIKYFSIAFIISIILGGCNGNSKNAFLYETNIKSDRYLLLRDNQDEYPYFYIQPYNLTNNNFSNVDSTFIARADTIAFSKDTILLFNKYLISDKYQYLHIKQNNSYAWIRHKIPLSEKELNFLKTFLSDDIQWAKAPMNTRIVLVEPFANPDKLFIETEFQHYFVANKKTEKITNLGCGTLEGCMMETDKKHVKCYIDLSWSDMYIDEDGNQRESAF